MKSSHVPYAVAACLLLLPVAASAAGAPASLNLIPMPQKVEMGEGALVLDARSRVVAADKELLPLAGVLSEEILTVTGVRLTAADSDGAKGDIVLRLDPAAAGGEAGGEGYRLVVGDRATVAGGNYFAVASGTVTLVQALRCKGDRLVLPRLTVEDKPAYPFRGAMIDLARKYSA